MIGRVYYLDSTVDPRNVLGLVGVPRVKASRSFWRVVARGAPFDRGPRRNVLVERVESLGPESSASSVFASESFRWSDGHLWRATGELMVRPFRGMRRVRESERA